MNKRPLIWHLYVVPPMIFATTLAVCNMATLSSSSGIVLTFLAIQGVGFAVGYSFGWEDKDTHTEKEKNREEA